MNTQAIVCAIAALFVSVSGVAFAQNDKDVRADRAGRGSYDVAVPQAPRDDRGRPGHDRSDGRHNDRDRPGYDDRRGYDGRHNDRGRPGYDDRRGYDVPSGYGDRRGYDDHRRRPPGHAPAYGYGDSRGAGPNHSFHRGGRLPPEWRSRHYVVDDWRGHRLSSPPRGHEWVQTGSDYVLVAIATGIIVSILLSQ